MNAGQDAARRGKVARMSTRIATALVASALVGGASVWGLTAQSAAGDNGCKVQTTMGEETVTGPGRTEPTGYRWVKTENIRCGSKSITIVTRGEYQRHSPFH